MGLSNPSRETKFSGANGYREDFFFPVQLTTSRIGILTRLILNLAICDDNTYIHVHTTYACARTLNFPGQLTTSRFGNRTRLIHVTLLLSVCRTYYTYMHVINSNTPLLYQ